MGIGPENTYDIFDFGTVSQLTGTFGTGATASHMSRGRRSYYSGLGGGRGGAAAGGVQTVTGYLEPYDPRDQRAMKSEWRDSAFGVPAGRR